MLTSAAELWRESVFAERYDVTAKFTFDFHARVQVDWRGSVQRNPIEAFLGYRVRENGTDRHADTQPETVTPPTTAVIGRRT